MEPNFPSIFTSENLKVLTTILVSAGTGAWIQRYLDKIKRKESYREYLFKERFDRYKELMKILVELHIKFIVNKDRNFAKEYLREDRMALNNFYWSNTLSISPKVGKLINNLLENLIPDKDRDQGGNAMGDLVEQMQHEVSSSKLLDNSEFAEIMDGKSFRELIKEESQNI